MSYRVLRDLLNGQKMPLNDTVGDDGRLIYRPQNRVGGHAYTSFELAHAMERTWCVVRESEEGREVGMPINLPPVQRASPSSKDALACAAEVEVHSTAPQLPSCAVSHRFGLLDPWFLSRTLGKSDGFAGTGEHSMDLKQKDGVRRQLLHGDGKPAGTTGGRGGGVDDRRRGQSPAPGGAGREEDRERVLSEEGTLSLNAATDDVN